MWRTPPARPAPALAARRSAGSDCRKTFIPSGAFCAVSATLAGHFASRRYGEAVQRAGGCRGLAAGAPVAGPSTGGERGPAPTKRQFCHVAAAHGCGLHHRLSHPPAGCWPAVLAGSGLSWRQRRQGCLPSDGGSPAEHPPPAAEPPAGAAEPGAPGAGHLFCGRRGWRHCEDDDGAAGQGELSLVWSRTPYSVLGQPHAAPGGAHCLPSDALLHCLCAQVKIIMQVSSVNTQSAAAKAAAQGGLISAFVTIGKTEGFMGYWRGNVPQARGAACDTRGGAHTRAADTALCPQVLRVLPYSACQLYRCGCARVHVLLLIVPCLSRPRGHPPQLREAEDMVRRQGWQANRARPPGRRRWCRRHQHAGAHTLL